MFLIQRQTFLGIYNQVNLKKKDLFQLSWLYCGSLNMILYNPI